VDFDTPLNTNIKQDEVDTKYGHDWDMGGKT